VAAYGAESLGLDANPGLRDRLLELADNRADPMEGVDRA
jgi:hypothetical protein